MIASRTSSSTTTKKIAWMRELVVTFTSSTLKKAITFGENYKNKDKSKRQDLEISCDIYTYMSALKDSATIKISNLTYAEIVTLITGKYYTIEIKAGYRNGNVMTVFKGGVLYISNQLNSRKTNTVIILSASELVAKYSQSRLNLSLNSGINLYSAINFVCRRAGITNSNVSTQFKKKFIQEIMNVSQTSGSWLEALTSANESYVISTDSSLSSIFTIYDAAKSNYRVITLKDDTIDLQGGYPRLNSNGLTLTVMPTFAFQCGDVIKIDNSIINLGVSSTSAAEKMPAMYLDKDGCYMITELHYELENRGSSFGLEITAKSRSLVSGLTSST